MREILFKPTLYKFQTFGEFAKEFELKKGDLVFTNKRIYDAYMQKENLPCSYAFRDTFGKGEPTEESIEAMFAAIPFDSYDRVVAIGGGAILDTAKLLGLERPDTVHNLFFKKYPVQKKKPVIAIPTTCGTGSEVTEISVAIVRDDAGQTTKLGLVSEELIPTTVCLIPELLRPLPYKPFVSSAIDALIHAVESYLSPARATMTSELFGSRAMELILQGFQRIAREGPDARFDFLEEFVTASLYAGLAFLQAGCATVHAMSFPLGGTYGVPHGESNYALFPKVLEKYDAIHPTGKITALKKTIARSLGGPEDQAIAALCALLQNILPVRPLREYGVQPADIEKFADSVLLNQQRLVINSYVPLDRSLIVEIYTECY